MSSSSQRKEATADFKSLVAASADWAEEMRDVHGVGPEDRSSGGVRGFLCWLWRRDSGTAATGPHLQQWSLTPSGDIPWPCWCGFLSSSQEKGVAEQRAIRDGIEMLRLSFDCDPEEEV
jgi:hypothetical protein